MITKPTSIDKYISNFPEPIQKRLTEIREAFKKAYPEVEESIRYGMPAFKLGKEHLYIAGYKKHIGMYPMYRSGEWEQEIEEYRGKGTKDAVHFLHTEPLPIDLINKIIVEKLKAAKSKK